MQLASSIFLFRQLLVRELSQKFKNTWLGWWWLIFHPLLMLAVYTLVFAQIFKARWPGVENTMEFAFMMFAGLVPFNMFAEVAAGAPGQIPGNANYVKKVIFPLAMLPTVRVAASFLTALLALAILVISRGIFEGGLKPTVVWTPLILLELVPTCLCASWLLSSFGVYIRDVGQAVGVIVSVLLFLSPIFFPANAIPEQARVLLHINPLVTPIEILRAALAGHPIDWIALGRHFLISCIAAYFGFNVFKRLARGFGDVL